MSRKVKSIEEALEILEGLNVGWMTVNIIKNSLWDTGVAFFDRSYHRVAYYDEVHKVFSIN